MAIGDRIRRIRKKRRLTQAELAMMSGLSLSAIQGYEQGRYEPKRKSLESIAEVFKIPVDELYDMPAQLSTNLSEVGTDCISRQAAIDTIEDFPHGDVWNVESMEEMVDRIKQLPSIQSKPLQPWEVLVAQAVLPQSAEPKRGRWILDRSGAYCCSECMEPCAGYVMMKPRDKFCKMCGSRNEVTE